MFEQTSTLGRSIFIESFMFLENFRSHKPMLVTPLCPAWNAPDSKDWGILGKVKIHLIKIQAEYPNRKG